MTPFTLTIIFRGKALITPCATLTECSAVYEELRDRSRLGASDWPEGLVTGHDGARYRVSYNGRVWRGTRYDPGAVPIYDNRTPAPAAA